jgi:ankyrin repeat protein
MPEDAKPDSYHERDNRIEQLKEMARSLNEGGEMPTVEKLKTLEAIAEESRQERPKPTRAEKEQMCAELRRKHGNLPQKTLLRKEIFARLKDIRDFAQEMRRAAQRDLSGPILMGDVALVRSRIAAGSNVNRSCTVGYSLLMLAGLQKQWEIVEILRQEGAEVGLHEAAMLGETVLLERLLDSGAEIEAKCKSNGFSALHWAASLGRTEAVRILLAHGANVDNVSDKGFTPLLNASSRNYPEVVALLRAHGAFLGVVEAAIVGDNTLLLQKLDAGDKIHSENAACMDPLMAAATCGHLDTMHLLLDRGADPHKTNARHISALIYAISNDRPEAVDCLLDSGLDVNAPGQEESEYLRGRTPLSHAILHRSPEMTHLLIVRGADIRVRDASGQTPLHWAAEHCHPEVLRILLDAGADVNASGKRQYTPLMSLVEDTLVNREVHRACVRLLLDREADVNARAEQGRTALIVAAGNGHGDLVEMLLKAGAKIDATDAQGSTALSAAARESHAEVVALLKRHGAKVNLVPNLLQAILFGHKDVAKSLLLPSLWKRRHSH